jgi:hypothetical protein
MAAASQIDVGGDARKIQAKRPRRLKHKEKLANPGSKHRFFLPASL